MEQMKEALGVAGWVKSKDLAARGKKGGDLTMWSDPDDRRVTIEVGGRSIENVRVGAEKDGMTFVQLIINNEDQVHVSTNVTAPKGFSPFTDPVLANLSARAVVSVIMV